MEATGNEDVSTLYFGAIVAMQLNLSSKTRNCISPYPVAKFLPCTLPRVSRGSARHVTKVIKVSGNSFLARGAGHYRASPARDTRENLP